MYAVEIASHVIIYLRSFVRKCAGAQTILGFGLRNLRCSNEVVLIRDAMIYVLSVIKIVSGIRK
jgi:hypothetical protein